MKTTLILLGLAGLVLAFVAAAGYFLIVLPYSVGGILAVILVLWIMGEL